MDCLIQTAGTENDIGAVIASIDNASLDLDFNVLGGSDLEPAVLGIPWSSDSSYVIAFGLGFPPGLLTPTQDARLLRDFEFENSDQFWSVGLPGGITS